MPHPLLNIPGQEFDLVHAPFKLAGIFATYQVETIAPQFGRVIRGEAREDILNEYDLHRRPLNIEFVQQQTIANKKRMEEKDPAARQRDFDQLRRTAEDPTAHRAYVRKASLLESVSKRATVDAA